MGELSRLHQRSDLRCAHDQSEVEVGIALVGNNLDGLLKHLTVEHGGRCVTCQRFGKNGSVLRTLPEKLACDKSQPFSYKVTWLHKLHGQAQCWSLVTHLTGPN